MKPISSYASIYIHEFDISVTPVVGKKPMLPGWQNIHGESVLAERFEDQWLKATGLGLLCGEASGIICLDIDITDGDDVLIQLRKDFLKRLPPIYLGRIGNPLKPPAIFYKYNGEPARKWNNIKIELLSNGNQVLLPPSLHPDTGDRYKWFDKRLSQVDLEYIPDLPDWIFAYLEEKNNLFKPKRLNGAGDGKGGTGYIKTGLTTSSGRCAHGSHNHISSFAVAKFREGLDTDELVRAVLSYDQKINKDSDYFYFECPSRAEWKGSNNMKANAKKFVRQIFNNPSLVEEHGKDKDKKLKIDDLDFWNIDKDGKRRSTSKFDDYITLFEVMYPSARRDYFSRNTFYKEKNDEWLPIDNEFKVIRSRARRCGLSVTHVEDHLSEWMNSLKPRLLIDIPTWDGKDHIGEVLSYIKVSNVSHDEFVSLFKAWMAGVFKRVFKPEFHNQCIIFKGKQGIGKDMFFGNIFKALNGYYSETIIQPRQKDNYESIEPLMVSYLPEFDESSRIPVSTIKAFISASKATFRGAYDRKASPHVFRHSVVSSANFDNILRDPTGNRRFWIFEVDNIDWDYNGVLDSAQCIAQAFALYKSNYKVQPAALSAMKEYIRMSTPLSNEELFMEDFKSWFYHFMEDLTEAKFNEEVKFSKKFPKDGRIRWDMISDRVVGMAKKYGYAARTAQSIIKKNGFSDADRQSTYYVIPE